MSSAILVFEDRPSDSPLIERIWRCHSERAGTFLSVASSHCEMVVTRHQGRTLLTLRGPETRPTTIDCPADGEWLGVRFALGTFLPRYPAATLIDRRDVESSHRVRSQLLVVGLHLGVSRLRECGDLRGASSEGRGGRA